MPSHEEVSEKFRELKQRRLTPVISGFDMVGEKYGKLFI